MHGRTAYTLQSEHSERNDQNANLLTNRTRAVNCNFSFVIWEIKKAVGQV